MKKLLLLCLLILSLISACTENKSVTEELNLDEVASLVEQDTLYEKVILDIESKRKLISENIVLQSKFKDLSIGNYFSYKKQTMDSTFARKIYDVAGIQYNNQMDSLLTIYKPKVDSIMEYYREQMRLTDPTWYFNVEFSGISKEYYSYDHEVKNVNVEFKITPLKGNIQGGSFNYEVIPKVTEKSVADGGCRFSSFTSKPTVYTWEAPYDVEKEFKYSSTNSIKNKYNFKFTILSVRQNNKTLKILDTYEIPLDYRLYMNDDTLSNYSYESIISSQFNVNTKSLLTIFSEMWKIEKRKLNPIAFEFEAISEKTN